MAFFINSLSQELYMELYILKSGFIRNLILHNRNAYSFYIYTHTYILLYQKFCCLIPCFFMLVEGSRDTRRKDD